TVPYDVLLDIFVHCLPQDRFEIRQPNTKIAPLLLCHICSSWRTIALTTPIIWSHLSFRFTLWVSPGGWAFRQNEIEFIRWWKQNQGSIAPFLRLAIEEEEETIPLDGEETTFAFVLNYITTAQHLEVHPSFWDRVWPVMMYILGGHVTFANLHSLVTHEQPPSDRLDHFHHTYPILRRLAIVDVLTPFRDTIPAQWSTLTHLSFTTYSISLDFWVQFTSAVPCLQWAYIYFNCYDQGRFDAYHIKRTLPQLSTLFIASGGRDNCSISPLFMGLHLPALDNLFLSSVVADWWDHRGIPDVYTILQSAPALRNLTLRKRYHLSPAELDYSTGTLPAVGDVAPIWSCAPHLVHLRLELLIAGDHSSQSEAAKELAIFARSAFFSNNRWLDLANPACPIKTITAVDHGSISLRHQPESDIAHRKIASVRKCAGHASNIALHVISQPHTDFADSWKEWRSGN
ncbi:hypothetical protein BJ912DRAFT_980888, partial [Pholiota molesta]